MTRTDTAPQRQLPLPFSRQVEGLGPFIAAPANEPARRMLEAWKASSGNEQGPAGILLAGPAGAGKTHLLRYLADDLGVAVHDSRALGDETVSLPEDRVMLLDDAHLCRPIDLLRLINVCIAAGRAYVLAGTGEPRRWAGDGEESLADLDSRLAATPTALLEKPDVDLMAQAIRALLQARQVRIAEPLAAFAASRLKRSFHAVVRFVETLDTEALERQKTIDKALVQTVLGRIPDAVL